MLIILVKISNFIENARNAFDNKITLQNLFKLVNNPLALYIEIRNLMKRIIAVYLNL